MQLRWTEEAAHDLEHIEGYPLTHPPSRAQDLVRAVYDALLRIY
jgi:plasmid stabilization system protein ParE